MTPTPKDMQRNRRWIALAAILVLAAVLRIVGLRWGLPNELHAYSYHPDEFLTVGASGRMAGLIDGHRSINPGLYNYPSLYLYISSLAMMVANGYGWLGGPQSIYLTARVITVLMGVGSVAAIYWAGRVMFGTTAGLLAALVLAIAPLHVQHSHFATVDVPSTLLVALSLGYSALILKRGIWRDYILAGVMAGLAAGTKYNAALVVFAPIAAHFLRAVEANCVPVAALDSAQSAPSPLRVRVGVWVRRCNCALHSVLSAKLWLIPACAIAAFIISTPGSVLYYEQFHKAIDYERVHQATGHGLVFAGTGNGLLYTFGTSLWLGLFPLLGMLALASLVGALCKRDKNQLILLAFAVPYYILISLSQVRFARYTLPLFPVIALLGGWGIHWCLQHARKRRDWVVVMGIYFGMSLLMTVLMLSLFIKPDTRDSAARWILSNVPVGSSVGMIDYPWFYTPPLSSRWSVSIEPLRREAVAKSPYALTVFSDRDEDGWWWRNGQPPQWIVLTDYETLDAVRLHNNTCISEADRKHVDAITADLDIVREHYVLRGRFANTMGMGSIRGFGTEQLPHDMRYVSPTIGIYELKR